MSRSNREVTKRIIKSSLKSYKRLSKSKNVVITKNDLEQGCCSTQLEALYNTSDMSHLYPVINQLEKLNIKYEILPDAQTKQNCFFLQDKFMNGFYKYYPEYLCVDILCEIPELDYTVALLIALDTNGHCEIVATGLIKSGNLYGLAWFYEVFKKHNPLWAKIELIISNENLDNKEVLVRAFPAKHIYFSFFHVMKAFKRDLSKVDPIVSNEDISKALQIFEEMFFVSSEAGYMELLKLMKQMPSNIFGLFKKNWHSKREFWTLGLQLDSKIFFKAFNSFLLNCRSKMKHIISSQDSLESVIQKLHFTVSELRRDLFKKFTCMFESPSYSFYCKLRVMQKFSKYLTPYATELVYEQLSNSENIKNVQKIDHCKYKVNGCEISVSFNACSCSFHTLMMLPCSHIFAARSYLSLPSYVESLRSSWVATKYHKTFLDLYFLFLSDKTELKSQQHNARFSQFVYICHEMWNLLLNCHENISQDRLEIFQNILKAWKSNFKIDIEVSEKKSDTSGNNSEALENLPTDYFKEMYGISLNDILDSENEFSSVSLCSDSSSDLF